MQFLGKAEILAADDGRFEVVEVPEWGGSVRVGIMTGAERDYLEASCITDKGGRDLNNFRARVLSLCIVDENGKREFTREDIAALGAKSAVALDRVFTVAAKLNGLSSADVKELVGN